MNAINTRSKYVFYISCTKIANQIRCPRGMAKLIQALIRPCIPLRKILQLVIISGRGLENLCKIFKVFLLNNLMYVVGPDVILMENNADLHRISLVSEYLNTNDITQINGPAYSPEMNPLEDIWYAISLQSISHQVTGRKI